MPLTRIPLYIEGCLRSDKLLQHNAALSLHTLAVYLPKFLAKVTTDGGSEVRG